MAGSRARMEGATSMGANQPSNRWGWMGGYDMDRRSPLKPWAIAQWFVAPLVGFMLTALPSSAQQTTSQLLPPPPPIVPLSAMDRQTLPNNFANQQEAVFQAPTGLVQPANTPRYLVYVNSDSAYLLQQVRTVDPSAFIREMQGRRVIQTGIFSSEVNARQQLSALALQGIAAEMTTGNAIASPNQNQAGRYMVVVPASRETLPALTRQAVRLGIRQNTIQQKDAPLGPHLEVGPFASHSQAQEINRFLRNAGMDARVYFR